MGAAWESGGARVVFWGRLSTRADRQRFFQTCREFGFYQTCEVAIDRTGSLLQRAGGILEALASPDTKITIVP